MTRSLTMIRFTRSVAKIAILISLVPGVVRAAGGAKTFPGVGLSVSTQTAPPGATTQVQISVTEPRPILTGGGSLDFAAFDSVFGIAIIAPGQDTYGVALERGTNIALSVLSPSSSFGMNVDYPILTIAGRVPANATIGTIFALPIDPTSFHFLDASGVPYPLETNAGQLTVGNSVAIGDVSPGSAVVPAGGIVTITGTNFVPSTDVRFKEAKLSQVLFVSSTRIDVVLAQTVTMHGMTIIAKNPDGTQATYYSYQRTRPMSVSSDPVMQFAVPLFPPKTGTTATISLPEPENHVTYGVALQNIDAGGAYATIELLDGGGNAIAVTGTNVDPSMFLVRELSELFGPTPSNASAVRVTSSAPIQVMGIAADQERGTADAIVEGVTVPKASATVTFDPATLSQTYDGTVKTVSTTTSPAGLPVDVVFTGTPQNAGSYPVTARINDTHFTGSATGTLTIDKASPTVVWNNPADIVYGTPLSPVQLNATASVAGTFAYTPAAGVVLRGRARITSQNKARV
jgi:IPT/TIG domain.